MVHDLFLSLVTSDGPILSWLKPFGLGLCIMYETTLDWLAFALISTLTKDEHQTPWGIGRPAWPRPAGLGLAPLGLALHQRVHRRL